MHGFCSKSSFVCFDGNVDEESVLDSAGLGGEPGLRSEGDAGHSSASGSSLVTDDKDCDDTKAF